MTSVANSLFSPATSIFKDSVRRERQQQQQEVLLHMPSEPSSITPQTSQFSPLSSRKNNNNWQSPPKTTKQQQKETGLTLSTDRQTKLKHQLLSECPELPPLKVTPCAKEEKPSTTLGSDALASSNPPSKTLSPNAEEQTNSLLQQLTAQLVQTHQNFRSGLFEAKEYHEKVVDLMVQLHTCHPPQTASVLTPLTIVQGDGEGTPKYVVLNSRNNPPFQYIHQTHMPCRLISTTTTNTDSLIPPAAAAAAAIVSPVLPASQNGSSSSSLNNKKIAAAMVTPPPPPSQGKETTARRLQSIAFGPSDLILIFQLMKKFDRPPSQEQMVALLYVMLDDISDALDDQLKLPLDAKFVSPTIRKILVSSESASAFAIGISPYAKTIVNIVQSHQIKTLQSKEVRLRTIAVEASIKKWKGKGLVKFITGFLRTMEDELNPREKIVLLKGIIQTFFESTPKNNNEKISNHILMLLNDIFPLCVEDASFRYSTYYEDNSELNLSNLIFDHGNCCDRCQSISIGFRFRIFNNKTEKRCCPHCFIRDMSSLEKDDLLNQSFLVDIPNSLLSTIPRYLRQLRHFSMTPIPNNNNSSSSCCWEESPIPYKPTTTDQEEEEAATIIQQQQKLFCDASLVKESNARNGRQHHHNETTMMTKDLTPLANSSSTTPQRTVTQKQTQLFTHFDQIMMTDPSDSAKKIEAQTLMSQQEYKDTKEQPMTHLAITRHLKTGEQQTTTSVSTIKKNGEIVTEFHSDNFQSNQQQQQQNDIPKISRRESHNSSQRILRSHDSSDEFDSTCKAQFPNTSQRTSNFNQKLSEDLKRTHHSSTCSPHCSPNNLSENTLHHHNEIQPSHDTSHTQSGIIEAETVETTSSSEDISDSSEPHTERNNVVKECLEETPISGYKMSKRAPYHHSNTLLTSSLINGSQTLGAAKGAIGTTSSHISKKIDQKISQGTFKSKTSFPSSTVIHKSFKTSVQGGVKTKESQLPSFASSLPIRRSRAFHDRLCGDSMRF